MNLLKLLFVILSLTVSSMSYAQFFEEDHLITDVRNNIISLRCSVGQTWDSDSKTCTGNLVKLNHDEIEIALRQASEQLGGEWRLPTLDELESLVCKEFEPPKIKKRYFPNISPEAYWTSKRNFLNRKMVWTVNFMTGHNYSRFHAYQQLLFYLFKTVSSNPQEPK